MMSVRYITVNVFMESKSAGDGTNSFWKVSVIGLHHILQTKKKPMGRAYRDISHVKMKNMSRTTSTKQFCLVMKNIHRAFLSGLFIGYAD